MKQFKACAHVVKRRYLEHLEEKAEEAASYSYIDSQHHSRAWRLKGILGMPEGKEGNRFTGIKCRWIDWLRTLRSSFKKTTTLNEQPDIEPAGEDTEV